MKSLVGIVLLAMLASCGPAHVPPVVLIETNETAFLVPLEGDSKDSQAAFMSVDFLKEAKVAAKRVTVPVRKRSTGRAWFDYEWIETMRVIKVSRAPVTREWTGTSDTGTTAKDEAISVESLDSIGFAIGVNITAMIEEDEAALFLNKYAGKSLAEVVDSDIRGFVLSVAADEFGSRSLQKCKLEKKSIFDKIRSQTKEHFKQFGVTITNLGHSEGLTYTNPAIQQSIDDAYVAEMDKEKAIQQQEAQNTRNATAEAIATSKRKQAQQFALASSAQRSMIELEIEKIKAEAYLKLADKWNGAYPASMMPEGANLLYQMMKNNK